MGVGDMLDRSFVLYRRHFWVFATVGVAFAIPMELVDALLLVVAGEGPVWQMASLAIVVLASMLLYAALIPPADDALRGVVPSVGRALGAVGARWPTALLLGAVITVAPTLLVVTILGLPFAVYLWVAWSLCYQVSILEAAGVRASLGRSRQLVAGGWWRCFGMAVVVALLGLGATVVVSVPAIVLTVIDQGGDASRPLSTTTWVVTYVSGAISTVLATPIFSIPWTLLYYDLCARKEGLDLQLRADELGAPPAGA